MLTGDNVEYGVYMSGGFSELYKQAERKMTEMDDSFISQEHLLLKS